MKRASRLRSWVVAVFLWSAGAFVPYGWGADILANPSNEELIDEESLKLMLTGKEKFWSSGSEVKIALLKSDPRIDELLTRYSGMTSNKFRNHWQRIAFSGRGKMPKVFASQKDLIDYIKANEGAIGIVSSLPADGGLRGIDLGLREQGQVTFYFAAR